MVVAVQAIWRGFVVRRALAEADENRNQAKRAARNAQEAELQERKLARDRRRKEDAAARFIQHRYRVLHAKVTVKYQREAKSMGNVRAGELLAQSNGVALLEKVMTRHRTGKMVMFEQYEQARNTRVTAV